MADAHRFDTELVSTVIGNLKHGKAPDVNGLCAEHLYFCHPSISLLLTKLFNYGHTLSDASMLYFADVFFLIFFVRALVGETAERIFTKLSHVVDIRCYLRTY